MRARPSPVVRSRRRPFTTAVAVALTLGAAGCGGSDGQITTVDSVPGTLGELDDVVITVAPSDLVGDPVRLEDVDGDGEVEVVEPEVIDGAASSDAVRSGDDATTATSVYRIDTTSDDESSEPASETASETSDDGLNPLGGDDPEDGRMPDVVCMGLQDAQDEIQDRGVFFSKSVDATGDGRRQLWDRNWIVVGQEPRPGESIGENEAVLSVVKKSEENPC